MASASRPARTALCSVASIQGQGVMGAAASLVLAALVGTVPKGISGCMSGLDEVVAMWDGSLRG
jgi:hypothetical protein